MCVSKLTTMGSDNGLSPDNHPAPRHYMSQCWYNVNWTFGNKLQSNRNQDLYINHDDVIKWKHFPRNWPFVREIHRSPVNFPHKGQRRGALMFSLIYAWINDWVNNREAGDLRRQHGHYDVIVMWNLEKSSGNWRQFVSASMCFIRCAPMVASRSRVHLRHHLPFYGATSSYHPLPTMRWHAKFYHCGIL